MLPGATLIVVEPATSFDAETSLDVGTLSGREADGTLLDSRCKMVLCVLSHLAQLSALAQFVQLCILLDLPRHL